MSARAWEDLGRPESELYRGIRLAGALAWSKRADVELAPTEQVFLDASSVRADTEVARLAKDVRRQARANRILRGAAGTIAVALAIAVVLGVLAVRQGRRADQQAGEAQAAALAQAAVAVGAASLDTDDPQLALLLAAAAQQLAPSSGTAFNLAAAVADRPELIRTVAVPSASGVGRMVVAGDRVLTVDRRHTVRSFTTEAWCLMRRTRPETVTSTRSTCPSRQRRTWSPWPQRPRIRGRSVARPGHADRTAPAAAGVPAGVTVQGLAVTATANTSARASGTSTSAARRKAGSTNVRKGVGPDVPEPVGPQINPPLPFTRLALSDDGATVFTSNPVSAYDLKTGRQLWQGNEAWTGDIDVRGGYWPHSPRTAPPCSC